MFMNNWNSIAKIGTRRKIDTVLWSIFECKSWYNVFIQFALRLFVGDGLFVCKHIHRSVNLVSQPRDSKQYATIVSIAFLFSMARSYRRSFIETSGGENMYAHQIFCSWEYSISYVKPAEMKKRSIFNELKLILDNLYDDKVEVNVWSGFWIFVSQITTNLFVIGILVAVAFFTWSLFDVSCD